VTLYEQPWPDGDYRFFQLGFVVEDLLAAAARWASVFGVGPFHVLPRTTTEWVSRGASTPMEMQIAVAQAGPVQIELIQQHDDTPAIFRGHEGGLHQLCTIASDYDAKVDHLRGLGYELAGEFRVPGQRIGFVDTVADFGFFTEIVDGPPEFLGHLAAIARTCAEWDGTDPVRLLTRDGYRTP
jgi:hypothetical protein